MVQISAAIAEVLQGKLKVDPSRVYLKVTLNMAHSTPPRQHKRQSDSVSIDGCPPMRLLAFSCASQHQLGVGLMP
jgi:hypothetical protein